MPSFPNLASLLLLSAAQARAASVHRPRDYPQGIKWGACDLNTTLPVECATIPVPLDYTDDSSSKTLDLDLIRLPAANQPSKGSILFNFGGPGQDGLNNLLAYAPLQGP